MVFVVVVLTLLGVSLAIALGVLSAQKQKSEPVPSQPTAASESTSDTTVSIATSETTSETNQSTSAPETTSETTQSTSAPETTETASTPETIVVCSTDECKRAGLAIKEAMNNTFDPCDDFYNYACGGWVQKAHIPDDKGRWGTFDELRDALADNCIKLLQEPIEDPNGAVANMKNFFTKCFDTETTDKIEGNKALLEILKRIGGSPSIPDTDYDSTKGWLDRVTSVRKAFGFNYMMSFQVSIDLKKPAGYIIYLDQASSFGLERVFLKNVEANKKYVDAYRDYIRSTFCLLSNIDDCNADYMETQIENIINFEAELAKYTTDPVERRDPNVWYVPMTVAELQENIADLPKSWKEHINDLLELPDPSVNDDTIIIVREEEYLKDMIKFAKGTEEETTANYVAWRVLQALGPYSSPDFRKNEFNFNKVIAEIQKPIEIDDKCFGVSNDYYGYALGSLYVKKHFSQEAKADMMEMETNIGNAFRTLLDENEWMDVETKKQAEQKLQDMVGMIAYPDWIEIPEELNKYYSHLEGTLVEESFVETFANVLKAASSHQLKKLYKETNRTFDWISAPTIVNAFYSPTANSITFPAGILQPPFYQHNTIQALNYGAIGYVIGHEITHGYDDQGSQYNGIGKLESWWSKETRDKYDERKECFIEQYNEQTVTIHETEILNLRGNQTIGENIADNGGIREAYQAYLSAKEGEIRLPGIEELETKKLFFLAAANIWCTVYRDESLKSQILTGVHSPGQFRAAIPLANTEDFAEVFGCKKGSLMNPEKKCRLW